MTKALSMNQKLFNKAYKGLRKQGFNQSTLSPGAPQCLYRGRLGRKCAVGHLIPNAVYDKDMERNGVYRLLEHFPWLTKYMDASPTFLSDLQRAHDNGETPDMMQERLAAVAEEYRLKIPA